MNTQSLQVPSTPVVIEVATISQYLADRALESSNFYNGELIDKRLPRLLYTERKSLEWAYNRDNTDTTLFGSGGYVYALCAPFSQTALAIINSTFIATITGPDSVTINVGQDATFTVSVFTTAPSYTLQWYRDGMPIVGQTGLSYTLTNAQLSDSGSVFSAIATTSGGTAQSQQALLTVTQTVVLGSYYFGSQDFFNDLNSGNDDVPYVDTFNITNGAPLAVPFGSGAANNMFEVVRYPDTQSIKTAWNNTALNSGTIPDAVYRTIISFGGFRYIISREAISLDSTNQTVIFS